MLPGTTLALLELKEQQASAYLQQHLAQLQAAGLTATALVSRGEPAKVIVQTARQAQADLIVLGTHDKTSLDAFWAGSITPKVVSQPHVPLLLVPVGAAEMGCNELPHHSLGAPLRLPAPQVVGQIPTSKSA